jgi:hypothetical protein
MQRPRAHPQIHPLTIGELRRARHRSRSLAARLQDVIAGSGTLQALLSCTLIVAMLLLVLLFSRA